jgi:hypothetical protein
MLFILSFYYVKKSAKELIAAIVVNNFCKVKEMIEKNKNLISERDKW